MLTFPKIRRHLRRPVPRRIHHRLILHTGDRKLNRRSHFRRSREQRPNHVRVVVIVRKTTVRDRRQTARHKGLGVNRERARPRCRRVARWVSRNRTERVRTRSQLPRLNGPDTLLDRRPVGLTIHGHDNPRTFLTRTDNPRLGNVCYTISIAHTAVAGRVQTRRKGLWGRRVNRQHT